MYSYFSHPNSVCMNYYKHLKVSLNYSRIFFIATIKSLVHAFIPNLFITSTTNTINKISNLLIMSSCNKNN